MVVQIALHLVNQVRKTIPMQRTDIDFSKHELIIAKSEGLLVHYLKKPGTINCAVKFINTNGIMAVTGDLGNWMFCREFHPSDEGGVSDGYWCEKLRISSTQESHDFSSEQTIQLIDECIIESDNEEEKEYLQECIEALEGGEWEYQQYAYSNQPSFYDSEGVPYGKEIKYHLKGVFDAFDEICSRMKNELNHNTDEKAK